MDYNKWMKKAEIAVLKTEVSKKFEVKHLFQEIEWNTLSSGERRQFGRYFKNEVMEGRVAGAEFLEKAKNNHAMYIRVEMKA